jgi:hypothetical protein
VFRKTWFWAAFGGLALAATLFSRLGFSEAFPLVDVDVSMTRTQAIEQARVLAGELGCGPPESRAAARFTLDGRAQVFVELEGGGPERVRELAADGSPTLSNWQVRFFSPGERNETRVSFTPGGEPWGFRETLADEAPGAALEPDEARRLATEALAASAFVIDLGEWEDVERSREVKLSGRVDHAFTWRHRTIDFGEGEYRLSLEVAGDRLTGVTRWIEVPEAFDRRYTEMRSINELIAALGGAGLGAFLLAGVGASLLVLFRQRALLWRPAFAWGLFVGGLQGLVILNAWPLSWFGYDTAISPAQHASLQALLAVGAFLGTGVLLGLTFVAAEGLSRRAFPKHPRLWSLWSKEVASTRSVLGMTVAGYLLVSLFFAYEVALQFAASRWLGWWSPVSASQDPDALATWFPWLQAIAISANAGFWEEALCRAVPLALAALVGRHFGKERAFVVVVLLLQAVVFGAGHANYPAQPAHARVLELTLPAIGFGLVFLRFGLLAAIVCHYVYDVVWIALPLFLSSAEGAGLQSALATFFALVPLLVVFLARARSGRWGELRPEHLNGSWRPPETAPLEARPDRGLEALPARTVSALAAGGLVGVVLFFALGDFDTDAPRLDVPRTEAIERARGELQSRGLVLGDDWRELSAARVDPGGGDDLAWRELGPEAYRDFLRDWAGEPEWTVRRVRVDGDVAERAEEWLVAVTASGHARVRHVVPEDRPGPRLGEDTARALAHAELDRSLGLGRADFEEVEARPDRLPERTDWRFTFRAPAAWPAETGEARAFVEIAGNEVLRVGRFVHVPEEWERRERERVFRLVLPAVVGGAVLALLLLGAGLGSLVIWSARRFSGRAAAFTLLIVAVAGLLDAWNSWPQAVAGFSTQESWTLQAWKTSGGLCSTALAIGSLAALLVGAAHGWARKGTGTSRRHAMGTGLGLGGLVAGLSTLGSSFGPELSPTWGDYTAAGSRLPWLTEALGGLPFLAAGAAVTILFVTAVDRLTEGLSRHRVVGLGLLVLVGVSLGLVGSVDSLGTLAVSALAGAAAMPAVWLVLRRAPAAIPAAFAAWLALGRVRTALQGVHPDQALGAGLSAVLLLVLGVWWSRRMETQRLRSPTQGLSWSSGHGA